MLSTATLLSYPPGRRLSETMCGRTFELSERVCSMMRYFPIIFLFLGSILYEILGAQNHKDEEDEMNKCHTPVCKLASANLLSSMNHYADPCEEFHEFVCGNKQRDKKQFSRANFEMIQRYLEKNVHDQSKKSLLVFRKFYESCIDFDPTFNFIENMKFIKKYTSTNLTGVFTESVLTQSLPFFDVGMNIRSDDGSYVFQITPLGRSSLKTAVEHWSVFQQVENECEEHLENSIFDETVKLNDLYENFEKCRLDSLLRYAGMFRKDMQFALNIPDYKDILKGLLVSLEDIAAVHFPNPDEFTNITIHELSQEYGIIEWRTFFEGLSSKTLTGNEVVEVQNREYLERVFDLMRNYDERALVDIIQEFSSFQLYKNLFSFHDTKKLYCMDLSQQLMPDITTLILYEEKNVHSHTSVLHTKRLFNIMKQTLMDSIRESTLDENTKSSFELKMNDLELGLITTGSSNTTENNYMNTVLSEDFKDNVLILLKNYRNTLFSLVESKSSAATLLEYFVNPFTDSPTTFYASNFIVLHPSLFDRIPAGYPKYIEVAKLGLLLAQGIAKHFDPIGRLFRTGDTDLQRDAYYSTITRSTKSLLDSFYLKSPYIFHGTSFEFEPIDGSSFINEMVVDNTAFRMITDYLETIDQDDQLPWIYSDIATHQIFIIAATQEFCEGYTRADFIRDLSEKKRLPLPIKIQNMLTNSEYFAEVYHCSEGATMDLDSSFMVQFPYKSADQDYEYEDPEMTGITDN